MAIIHSIVVLASVFLIVGIQTTDSKPQPEVSLPADNGDFLALFDVKNATTSNKQTSTLPAGNNAFLDLFNTKDPGECKCVPIVSCCDARPDENSSNSGSTNDTSVIDDLVTVEGAPIIAGVAGIGVRTIGNTEQNFIIDIGDRSISPCPDILSVCCDKECPKRRVEESSTSTPAQSSQCGIRNSNGFRITVTGFEEGQAQLSEFPWMVAVLGQDNAYVAGGSLVDARVILTAAHKVHDYNGNTVARIGDWDLSATSEPIPSQAINVTKVLYHPDFSRGTLVNDVALLILETDAALGDTVMPICLPEIDQVFDESTCYVSGWGKDVFGTTGKYQKIMKKVSVPAVSHSQCQNMLRTTRLGSTFNLHDTFNCAGGEGEDACEGDGGSPLVCPNPNNPEQYVQMGVVAWGIGCGIAGNPGVYGSIPKTVKWIRETIQKEVGFNIRSFSQDGRGK